MSNGAGRERPLMLIDISVILLVCFHFRCYLVVVIIWCCLFGGGGALVFGFGVGEFRAVGLDLAFR